MSSSLFGGSVGDGMRALGSDILFRAIGSWMRGEDPKKFLRGIATKHPAFKQINADDLEKEASRICKEHGMDETEIVAQVKQYLAKM